jgi:hypothetical protein
MKTLLIIILIFLWGCEPAFPAPRHHHSSKSKYKSYFAPVHRIQINHMYNSFPETSKWEKASKNTIYKSNRRTK